MKLASVRPQGRIPRNFMKIRRMEQFPTTVRLKFVMDANTTIAMSATMDQTRSIDLVPVTTFTTPWIQTGYATAMNNYPPGWITWMNAYGYYKTLAARTELYCAQVSASSVSSAIIVCAKLTNNTSDSVTYGVPANWIYDPTAKRCTISSVNNTEVNQPSMVIYAKPRDIWKDNQDWDVIRASMTSQPDRFMKLKVGFVRQISGGTTDIQFNLRARVTLYVELFDRKSSLDYNVDPPAVDIPEGLKAKLTEKGQAVFLPETVIESKG